MQGDDIEVTLHHHSTVLLADGVGGLVETEQMLAFLEHLRLWGVQVFGLAAIQTPATEANHTTLTVVNRNHHPMAKTVVEAIATLAGDHQSSCLQQLSRKAFHLLQMLQQAVPLVRGITETECLLSGECQAAGFREVGKGLLTRRAAQLAAKPTCRQGQGPLKLLPPGELLLQPLLLRTINGLDRHLIATGQIQHHIAETLPLKLHQELDGIAARTTGEAVVELLGGRHRHRRLAVVVKRTDADKLPSFLFQNDVVAHHIDDVRPLFDGVDGAGMKSGIDHGPILRSRRSASTHQEHQRNHG